MRLQRTVRTRTSETLREARNNFVKNENGDLLEDLHNVLNRMKNFFSHVLNVHGFRNVIFVGTLLKFI
jgi:hypothetical protein